MLLLKYHSLGKRIMKFFLINSSTSALNGPIFLFHSSFIFVLFFYVYFSLQNWVYIFEYSKYKSVYYLKTLKYIKQNNRHCLYVNKHNHHIKKDTLIWYNIVYWCLNFPKKIFYFQINFCFIIYFVCFLKENPK